MTRLLLLAWLLQPAAQMSAASSFEAGMACFARLDFACARDLLTDALQRLPASEIDRRTQARRALAESHLALGQREAAVAQFEALFLERPGFAIERRGVSPKILDALDEARERLRPTGPPAAEPAAPTRFELFTDLGAEFVTGTDRRYLADGPAAGLGLLRRFGALRLGGWLRYTHHPAEANSRSLHLGGGCLLAGLAWETERWEALLAAGVGVARFGVPAEEGRFALWLPLRARAGFRWSGRFSTGLALTPGWLLLLDGPGSSFSVSLEGVVGFWF
ncbi:MAG: hypothetical protein GYA21_13975 [Myxococcales bacterium]|nr:hypothetical protein [Myxococcales bacterium]